MNDTRTTTSPLRNIACIFLRLWLLSFQNDTGGNLTQVLEKLFKLTKPATSVARFQLQLVNLEGDIVGATRVATITRRFLITFRASYTSTSRDRTFQLVIWIDWNTLRLVHTASYQDDDESSHDASTTTIIISYTLFPPSSIATHPGRSPARNQQRQRSQGTAPVPTCIIVDLEISTGVIDK